MADRIPRHWKSRFAHFIESYGPTRLARALEISPTAIYHWIRGAHTPKPVHAEIIQRLARESGVKLTFDQIYGHSRDLRASGDESWVTGFSDDGGDPRESIRARRGNVAPL